MLIDTVRFPSFIEAWEHYKNNTEDIFELFGALCEAYNISSDLALDACTEEELLREVGFIIDRLKTRKYTHPTWKDAIFWEG